MILPVGISGFGAGLAPGVSFREFIRACHLVSGPYGWQVHDKRESGITPNFHAATLQASRWSVRMVCSAAYPFIAFVEFGSESACTLRFCDPPDEVLTAFSRIEGFQLLGRFQLESPLTRDMLGQLCRDEHEQLKYWKPATVGALIFNWWD